MMTKTLNLTMTPNKILMFGGQLLMIMEKFSPQEIPMEYKLSKHTRMFKYHQVKMFQKFSKLTVEQPLKSQLFILTLMLKETPPTLLIV
jgi:hypothetical protein